MSTRFVVTFAILVSLLSISVVAQATPVINSLSYASMPVGGQQCAVGTSFGSPQGTGTITLNGTAMSAVSWTNTQVCFKVPAATPTGTATVLFAACDPPRYGKAVVYENSHSSTLVQISIPLADFAPRRLVCLAEAFKRSYPNRKNIGISIFSSHDAAKHYRVFYGDTVDGPAVDWGAQMHGEYFYDDDKHVEYVEILPMGAHSSFTTKIDLPSSNVPQCQLQMNARCLIALEPLEYPRDALKAGISGAVMLTATIDRDGALVDARVAKTELKSQGDKGLLEDAALHNLRSWRFEQSHQKDKVRITFSYEITVSGNDRNKPKLEFDLPTITVRAKSGD